MNVTYACTSYKCAQGTNILAFTKYLTINFQEH